MSAQVPDPVCVPTSAPQKRPRHLTLLQGGRALSPEPFVVEPAAVRAAVAAMAWASTSRAVRMAEADLVRCRTYRPLAR